MIEYARETGTVLQLIELDPINVTSNYYQTHHRSLDEQEQMLEKMPKQLRKDPLCTTA